MNDQQLEDLIAKIISRLVPRLGADGRNGRLIAVFTGATAAFGDAVQQVRNLVLQGFQLQLSFTSSAEDLVRAAVQTQLAGFPHITDLDPTRWLKAVQEARAIVVPLLSVNTLSKISRLLADNPASNVILHALFMGKPVVMAADGVDPNGSGRRRLGFHQGTPALQQALQERLRTASDFGCRLVPAARLCPTLTQILGTQAGSTQMRSFAPAPNGRPLQVTDQVISVSRVAQAHRAGVELSIPAAAIVTPLAREWAASHGVRVTRGEGDAGKTTAFA